MDECKREKICEILLMPIKCDKYKYKQVHREDGVIYTGQRYNRCSDADMSDFAIGYYEIIYENILGSNQILLDNGGLRCYDFAGDTMNSFDTVANRVPGAGKSKKERKAIPRNDWPQYLQEYELNYHCLANFWLLPLEVGRTGKPMSKLMAAKDYMDRFLKFYQANEKMYKEKYKEYFLKFGGFEEFVKSHFLIGSNINENMQIEIYSTPIKDGKDFIQQARKMMEHRAESISKSKYADPLWKYFKKLNVLKES